MAKDDLMLVREWVYDVQKRWMATTGIVNSAPVILRGTRPGQDIHTLSNSSQTRAWFWYPADSLPDLYIDLLLEAIDHNRYLVLIERAINISDTLGIDIQREFVPDAWVMSVERIRPPV